jgi:predicted Zn finger-like uncharacterized protein
MLTQCPNCQTTFRVTSEILRVADGQVRCGRCQTQFDALERLLDETDAPDVQSGRFLLPTSAPEGDSGSEIEEPAERDNITLESGRHEITGSYRVLDDEEGQRREGEEIAEEWIEFEDDDAAIDGGIEVVEESPEERLGELIEDSGEPATDDLEAQTAEEPSPDFELPPQRSERAVAPHWRWLAAPLVLLLIVQAVHHSRATLARHPRVGAALVGVYDALGLALTPDWNLHAYEIRQWGVVSDPAKPGSLKVRASVTNLAEFAQPYPLLKLMLEDRWGDQVRARAFEPAEYLDPGVAPERLLAPAQKVNATIDIVDPGPDAEGFRFDVCLRGKQRVVCAEETPAR